jgi:hypothetical protein
LCVRFRVGVFGCLCAVVVRLLVVVACECLLFCAVL